MPQQRKGLTCRNISLSKVTFSTDPLVRFGNIELSFEIIFHLGGILPHSPTFDNWTRAEAMQQGLTAEVHCTATPADDPYIRIRRTTVAHDVEEVSLCCNCTSGRTDMAG